MNTHDKTHRKTAIIVGVLYISGTVSGILSLSFSDAVRNAQNYLTQVSADENRIIIAALFVLTMGLALAMVPVMLYPVLKKENQALALGYVVFRGALETVGYMLTTISWLMLVPLSRVYLQAGAENAALLELFGTVFFEGEVVGSVMHLIFCLGAVMFYTALFRSKLVPRWLSSWGLLALIPYISVGLLTMFGVFGPLSSTSVAMQMPLALQEMVLAVWLIVKGFNRLDSFLPTETDTKDG